MISSKLQNVIGNARFQPRGHSKARVNRAKIGGHESGWQAHARVSGLFLESIREAGNYRMTKGGVQSHGIAFKVASVG